LSIMNDLTRVDRHFRGLIAIAATTGDDKGGNILKATLVVERADSELPHSSGLPRSFVPNDVAAPTQSKVDIE